MPQPAFVRAPASSDIVILGPERRTTTSQAQLRLKGPTSPSFVPSEPGHPMRPNAESAKTYHRRQPERSAREGESHACCHLRSILIRIAAPRLDRGSSSVV